MRASFVLECWVIASACLTILLNCNFQQVRNLGRSHCWGASRGLPAWLIQEVREGYSYWDVSWKRPLTRDGLQPVERPIALHPTDL